MDPFVLMHWIASSWDTNFWLNRGQSGAEPDVRVDVRTRVVQVQIEHASVGSVVPIAATDRELIWPIPHRFLLLFYSFHPSANHFANFRKHSTPVFIFPERKKHEFLVC